MSNDTKIKDADYYTDWLNKSVTEGHIKYYDYDSEFKNMQLIGNGSFGSVVRATWKNTDRIFALKSFFNNDKITLKEIVKELNIHRNVDVHENIIRFCGVTNAETDTMKYTLVLEYADSGSLKKYLYKHFNELDWNDKYQLALQLASAVEYMHECDIIHRDLNANNVLVNKKNIKIADFGLSKKIAESSNMSEILGVPYIDPKIFNNKNHISDKSENYKLNKKSDVYSIGVLLWQISSGCRPFYSNYPEGVKYDISLALAIQGGEREKIIDGTPVKYSNLYTECWKYDPNERPNMQDVVLILKEIISPEKYNVLINEEMGSNLLQKPKFNSNSNKESLDINKDLILDNLPDIINSESGLNLSSQQSTQLNMMYSINNSSSISIQTNLSCGSTLDKINDIIIKKLIPMIIKKHDKEGIDFDKIRQYINQQILNLNQNPDNLIKWLSETQVNNSQYIYLLGLFYFYDIGVKENHIKAFESFLQASKDNFSIAQVYLGKCYYNGYGVECNDNLAFKWYQKSAENGSIIGQFYLGNCYEFGIGIKKDVEKSVYWYEKAAKNGNITAKLYLADCYRFGKGIEKNEIKAFKNYENLAKKEIADAQYQLGNCFYNGTGTKIDKVQARYWYEKAIENGNINARDALKKYYNKTHKHKEINKFQKMIKTLSFQHFKTKLVRKNNKEKGFNYIQKEIVNQTPFDLNNFCKKDKGVKKNESKAFESYKTSAEQGNTSAKFQLGYCYDEGIGTDVNKVKAFELYKAAAEKGNNEALYNLSFLYELDEGVDKDEKKAFEIIKKLAEKGDLDAKYKLARYYNKGIGIEINKVKAFELCKKVAEKGNDNAQYDLSLLYSLGEGVGKDEKRAFEIIKDLAEKEYLNAQFKLGYYYDEGIGTEINKSKAFELYKIAAEKGNHVAQYNLGLFYEFGKGVDKDEKKAFEIIKDLAEKEYLSAQSQLGYYYDEGIGTEINKPKAFELYKIAAEKGDHVAQYNLGLLYQSGKGVDKDEKKAFKIIKDLAEKEYLKAQFQLGYYYDEGIGTEINKLKACELYKIAAEKGDNDAQYNLGLSYQLGEGVDEDEKKAFELMKDLAEKEYLNAQYQLGYYYNEGIGTEINKSKAFELYKIAAEKGDHVAKYNLSLLYQSGEGADKDEKKAFEIIKDLAGKEYLSAQSQLGYYYSNGIGTEINKSKACELYTITAEKGDNDAQYILGLSYQLGEGVDKDEKKAFKIIKDLAEKEYLDAQFQLGYYYSNGIGTEINKSKAFELYKIAAEKGDHVAQYNLGLLYQSGKGVDKDEKKAFEIIKDLAEKEYLSAQSQLGYYYDEGIGTEINKPKAFELYKIAAEKGDHVAQYNLSLLYQSGEGADKDEKKAFEIIKDLAGKEYLSAQSQLGYYYSNGIGTEINKSKACELYTITAEKGDYDAQYILGLSYQLGEGVDKDEKKAFKIIKDLAEKEYLNAQYQLGYYYNEGIGTEINKSKAFELYKIAAEKGDHVAQYNLGLLYQSGEGADKDEKKAFEIIKDLAEKEYLSAQSQLGYYYSNGIGTEINKLKACELYKIAAEKGDNDAQYNLSLLYQLGEGVDKDEAKAFELMKDLAEKEYLDAQFQLGYYYSNGIGTEINKSKAFELYKIAAEKENKNAQYNLSLLYQLGEGVDKDEKKAFKIMKDLAEKEYLDAQFQLGYYYSNGIETEEKVFEMTKDLAEKEYLDTIPAEKDSIVRTHSDKLENKEYQETELKKNITEKEKIEEHKTNSKRQNELKNSIFWSDALEARLCELYIKDDVVDIFWGQPIKEYLTNGIWNVYVVTHGLHHSYAKTEMTTDNQMIYFIEEEENFDSFDNDDDLSSSIEIPQDLKENFNEALDNELGSSFREAHYNLVGMSTGYKQKNGQLTDIPAILLYVRQKGILRRGSGGIFPKTIRGFPTDVIEACVATSCTVSGDTCRYYQDDVKLGSSIGIGLEETQNTTGTLSAVAYENDSPNRVGIISCEHVLKFNESDSEKGVTIYQPSYEDHLFEPKKKLEKLVELSKESGARENGYKHKIEMTQKDLDFAKSQNAMLAIYMNGMRKNFLSKADNKYYGVDAGFCVFNNEKRTLCPKKFPISSIDFTNAGLSTTTLEGVYTKDELMSLNHNTKVFKVGRTTGLTFGRFLSANLTIACKLTNESIKNAKKLAMEKNIPPYSNAEQEIFIGYMKSQPDLEIRQKRKKCFPIVWFDRQLAFKFKYGDFEHGDSGASVIDEKGKALGILHAKSITQSLTFGIVSPYFAVLEALNVNICLSSDFIAPTTTLSSSEPSSSSDEETR